MAVAICFGLGHEMADVPDSKERKEIMDMLPPEQLAFRAEVNVAIWNERCES